MRPKLLDFGLYSLSKQTISYPYEIIVLNDGTKDETEKVCDKYKNKLNIKYVFTGQRNLNGKVIWRTPGIVINQGVEIAKGKTIILTSPEIYLLDQCIQSMVNPTSSNKKILTVTQGFDDTRGIFLQHLKDNKGKSEGFNFKMLDKLDTKMPFFMAVDRQKFLSIGGYDEKFTGLAFDDADFIDRLRLTGCRYETLSARAVHLYHSRKIREGMTNEEKMERWGYNKELYEKNNIFVASNDNKVTETKKDTEIPIIETKKPIIEFPSSKWKLEKIPKIVHFYWGNKKLSYLRYLSVYTFYKYNPDWEIRFYYPKHRNNEITWTTFEQKNTKEIKDDCYPKLKKLPIKFIEFDFKILNLDNNMSEVHKASFLRQYLLSTEGGLWSDMDILYFKSMNNLSLNKENNKNIDTIVCGEKRRKKEQIRYSVAFVLSSKNNEFFNFTYNKAIEKYDPKEYQCIGATLLNTNFPRIERIKCKFPNLNIANLSMNTVYAYNVLNIEKIYNSSNLNKFTNESIGIHWYAGYSLASKYINKLTHKNYYKFNNVLCRTINISLKNIKESKIYKPIFYYSVMTGNRGDMAIRKSIIESIKKYLDIPFALFNVKYEELTEKRIINQLNKDGSCLMIAGSGLYTNYPKSSGWYFPCKTKLFKKIKVPIILLGIGNNRNLKGKILNNNLNSTSQKSIKLINNLASISTVRDKNTYNLLKNLGIDKHELLLDPANFLECPNVERKKRVAINIAQHSPLLGRFDGNDKLKKKNLIYFSKISKYLIKKGYEIIFITHDALEQSLVSDLEKLVPQLKHLNTDDINIMLEEYAKCQFSIGIKMHSNIMSFATATPFISLYYDKKSIEYLDLINFSDFGISVFENYYENLKLKVDKMIDNWKHYSRYFKRIKKKEKMKFQKIIKRICNIIQKIN